MLERAGRLRAWEAVVLTPNNPDPEPFPVDTKSFFNLFQTVLARQEFRGRRTADYATPWFVRNRDTIKNLWTQLQAKSRSA